MSFAERLLLRLSSDPGNGAPHAPAEANHSLANALDELNAVFPDLRALISGRDVLDFGCGEGLQAVAMAQRGAASVVGVDTNPRLLASARALARAERMDDRVRFVERIGGEHQGAFDLVISQNSMEHFDEPGAILRLMRQALRPTGRLLITFSPPWYAPYGSHMHFFTRVPWVHLLFSERTVMAVRARYRSDGATRYVQVEGGLNRMSLRKFERLLSQCGLRPTWIRYDPVKRLPAVSRIPVLRELLVNRVTCLLQPYTVPRTPS